MNKFSFWLWSINGILIFGLLATLIYNRPAWLFVNQDTETNTITETYPTYYASPFSWGSVLVDRTKIAKEYADYESISIITGTQENAGYTLSSLVSVDIKAINQGVYQYFSSNALNNVIFSDKSQKITHKLLDRSAYIHFVDFSASTLYNNETGAYFSAEPNYILYKISFEDTNNDGLLNEQDLAGLYISDIDGKNLRLITPANTFCVGYDFPTTDHQIIRVSYVAKGNNGKLQKNTQKFANYNVGKKTFEDLTEMNDILKSL